MNLEYGILLFVLGCTATFVGFFTAFLVINYNQKKEKEKKELQKGPMYDLNKDMPGSKAGDDCQ